MLIILQVVSFNIFPSSVERIGFFFHDIQYNFITNLQNKFTTVDNIINGYYFPDDIGISKFENDWYSSQLRALQEPIIFTQAKDENKSVYRFTCLRSFDKPFSIRVEINKNTETGELYFKMCDGAGGYDPGKLVLNSAKLLDNSQLESIVRIFNQNNFWELPVKDGKDGLDGSQWIIEAFDNGKYYVVDRWMPSDGAAYNIGNSFIDLSGQNKGLGDILNNE